MPDTSIAGQRVDRELDQFIAQPDASGMIVNVNVTERTSNAIVKWCWEKCLDWHYLAPGGTMHNGYIEDFSDRIRDELVNRTLFLRLARARTGIASWVKGYNKGRPHSSIGNEIRTALVAKLDKQ